MVPVPSSPKSLESGLSALSRELAPCPIQVTFCAGNALPFRLQWSTRRGLATFYGLTPDDAAAEACAALARGTVERPQREVPVADPIGNTEWAEAMRGLIADIEDQREPRRGHLRIVR
jgi:hypothetical protein